MIVYPAIDIRRGRVVRLVHGDPERETVHGDDPVAVAARWRDAGAKWLHVVNLDGALGEAAQAPTSCRRSQRWACRCSSAGIALAGRRGAGVDAGASRVILGTLAVREPEQAGEAVARFGADAVAVALDARGDRVATHGWQQVSAWTPAELGRRFAEMGVRHALFTDVSRDGDLSGVAVEATAALARETGLAVIASGGVAGLDDLRALRAARDIAGVVIGKALYTGALRLEDALAEVN